MQFDDYATRYHTIRFSREGGVLEMTIHTRGGPALWGTSLNSLHTELGDAFLDIARDRENKVVLLTGTGDSFIDVRDPVERASETSLAAMWPRIYDEGLALLQNLLAIPVPVIAAVNGPALIHAELAAGLAKLATPLLRYTRTVLVKDLRRRMADELPSGLAHEALATLLPPG